MDPTLEIITACMNKMKQDTAITNFVSSRIFDRVPEKQDSKGLFFPDVISPYISLGTTSLLTDDFDCVDAVVINLQWNVWSWGELDAYASAEVRKLSHLVRKCLHKSEINLTENGFVEIQHQMTAYNRAADGLTNQATLTFEILVDIID